VTFTYSNQSAVITSVNNADGEVVEFHNDASYPGTIQKDAHESQLIASAKAT
jgi:hypothetical protein